MGDLNSPRRLLGQPARERDYFDQVHAALHLKPTRLTHGPDDHDWFRLVVLYENLDMGVFKIFAIRRSYGIRQFTFRQARSSNLVNEWEANGPVFVYSNGFP
jgi:hypothetical protein